MVSRAPTLTETWDCPALVAAGASPIVIPLDGGDYDDAFGDPKSGRDVRFDFYGDGRMLPFTWIRKDLPYGFLVLPSRGREGVINSSKAMFGNITIQRAPVGTDFDQHRFYPNGFNALAYFDKLDPNNPQLGGNGDGVINAKDKVWADLRVWEDTCHCGDSRKGKMYTLDELGISSIDLSYERENRQDRYGNKLSFKGSMEQNGKRVTIYDVYFVQTNLAN